ncbi:MAG: hypothetical protein R2853_14860 [Thermomicrobiales bacterium]
MSRQLVMIRIEIRDGGPAGIRRSPRPTLEPPPGDEQGRRLAIGPSEGSLEEATWEDAEWR